MKWYKSLTDQKKRIEEGYFLVEGIRAVNQIVAVSGGLEEVLVTEEQLEAASALGCSVRELTRSQLLSVSSSTTPQGLIGVVKLPGEVYNSVLPSRPGHRILLLENIQDPGNVGSLIRTAAALDFSGVILSLQTADPFSPKAVQASAGALLSLWLKRVDNYLDMVSGLKERGHKLFCADVRGEPHAGFAGVQKIIMALGNEGSGLTKKIMNYSDFLFRIPINSQKVESLNVAASGAIAMFCASASMDW